MFHCYCILCSREDLELFLSTKYIAYIPLEYIKHKNRNLHNIVYLKTNGRDY